MTTSLLPRIRRSQDADRTMADLLAQLGGISPSRILLDPPPGTATEADVVENRARKNRLFELIDGTLVEKQMGYAQSMLAMFLISVLEPFVADRNLGLVAGEAGMLQLMPGLIRIPDVSYVSWKRVPDGRVPSDAVPAMAPDLAVEVLSEGNTPAEMSRKRDEYFAAGCLLVWQIDPKARQVQVFRPDRAIAQLGAADVLSGGDVLPGFSLELARLFGVLDRRAPEKRD